MGIIVWKLDIVTLFLVKTAFIPASQSAPTDSNDIFVIFWKIVAVCASFGTSNFKSASSSPINFCPFGKPTVIGYAAGLLLSQGACLFM